MDNYEVNKKCDIDGKVWEKGVFFYLESSHTIL